MGLNKTQCPHCFTTYVISDEQYRVSEGMVRCGTCRERFHAKLFSSEQTPKFDPRRAFIEPISEEATSSVVESIEESPEIRFVEPKTESKPVDPIEQQQSANSDATSETEEPAPTIDIEFRSTQITSHQTQDNNSRGQQSDDGKKPLSPRSYADAHQAELDLPLPNREPQPARSKAQRSTRSERRTAKSNRIEPTSQVSTTTNKANQANDDRLIDEVDKLVDNKLVRPTQSAPSNPVRNRALRKPVRTRKQKKPQFLRWATLLIYCVMIPTLGLTLVYQLWLKQIVVFPPDSQAEQLMHRAVEPVKDALQERDIELPVRRNLSQLELLSARTEAHPTRSSTTLLRISLINHADITQPLPWLELTLYDADGRLVSRRQLPPRDYLYNNNTSSQIGAKELKKITIEVLSFPKQATGYELKLLNK